MNVTWCNGYRRRNWTQRYEFKSWTEAKVIDTLTQEDFHVAFQKLLERHNKRIAAGEDYFEWD